MKGLDIGVYYRPLHKKKRVVTKQLVEHFGKCYWCGCGVKQYSEEYKEKFGIPANMATLDHIKPFPLRVKFENTPKVLACYSCNNKKGNDFWSMKNGYFQRRDFS